MRGGWAERENDEPLEDWMLRLALTHAAVAGLIRIEARPPIPIDRNVQVPERTAS